MNLGPNTLYHIYNRGNNKQVIFIQERNYTYFLQKAFKELQAHVDFLSYCLMPNHFHFLIYSKSNIDTKQFSNSLRILLSSYTRAIQKQENSTGSLFQQNTKAKELTTNQYAFTCFQYIHQNPLRAKLTARLEDWPYHSFNEYLKEGSGICNVALGRQLLTIATEYEPFCKESYSVISDEEIKKLF